ncbi:hypothetical protein [Oryzobacter terrae]
MSGTRTVALARESGVVVGVMAGAPPSPARPLGEIVAFIADHRAGLAIGL